MTSWLTSFPASSHAVRATASGSAAAERERVALLFDLHAHLHVARLRRGARDRGQKERSDESEGQGTTYLHGRRARAPRVPRPAPQSNRVFSRARVRDVSRKHHRVLPVHSMLALGPGPQLQDTSTRPFGSGKPLLHVVPVRLGQAQAQALTLVS